MKQMNQKITVKEVLLIIVSLVLVAVGVSLIFLPQYVPKHFSGLTYVMIGVGVGVISQMISSIIERKEKREDPDRARTLEIEAKDERNKWIREKAKAKNIQFYDDHLYSDDFNIDVNRTSI